MSIFIITNRSTEGARGKERIKDIGKEKGLSTFRIAECTLTDHGTEYKVLSDSNPNKYRKGGARCESSKLSGSEKMFCTLYQELMSSCETPSDVLFFIHGYAYSFKDELEHVRQLHELYVEPKDNPIDHIVYLSWPTIGHMVLSYWDDQEDAEQAGTIVARLFNLLRGFYIDMFELGENQRCGHKIHLMAHSMGNQVLEHALNKLDKRKRFKMFEEVLLLNSDVEWTVFEPGGAFRNLEEISERVHMYIHRSDDALRISKYTKNWNKRLGSQGPKSPSELPNNTYIVDTTGTKTLFRKDWTAKTKEKSFDHWGYLYRKEVIKDIRHVLNGIDEDDIPERHTWSLEDRYYYLGPKQQNK